MLLPNMEAAQLTVGEYVALHDLWPPAPVISQRIEGRDIQGIEAEDAATPAKGRGCASRTARVDVGYHPSIRERIAPERESALQARVVLGVRPLGALSPYEKRCNRAKKENN